MEKLVKDLKDFIRFKTLTSESDAAFAIRVGKILKRGGFKVIYQKIHQKGILFVNVIGIKGGVGAHGKKVGARHASPLLLCSHLDTVPPGDLKRWTKTGGDPWKPGVRAGRIYGLGAADDKGPLAAMLHAGLSFPETKLRRPLVVMGTFGEESGMGGARTFVRHWRGPKPLAVIAGEPTNLEITYRHKGIGVIVIELFSKNKMALPTHEKKVKRFKGKQGHSSRPWLGDNALDKAVIFLRSLARANKNTVIFDLSGGHAANIIPGSAELCFAGTSERKTERGPFEKKRSFVFPAAAFLDCHDAVQAYIKRMASVQDKTFYPSVVTSNFGIAVVNKNMLSLTFDFRLLPGIKPETIFSYLKRELKKRLSRYRTLDFRLWIERDNPALDARTKDALPRFGRRLLRLSGLPEVLSVKPACTEAGIYHAWGVPAVIFGPGESAGNIHAPNESVSVAQLGKAVQFYKTAIEEICVKEALCF